MVETSPPSTLVEIQRWFSQALARPLPGEGGGQGPRDPEDSARARRAIRSANGVDGWERLLLYRRQYWFRFLGVLQPEYPCALHVMGLDVFNAWLVRYLDAHPPATPYLADLDHGLSAFMEKAYDGENRATVLEALAYDYAFSHAMDAPEGAPIRLDAPAGRLSLSPHATPLWLSRDFSAYRPLCREDEELTGSFSLAERDYGVLIYRHGHTLYEKEIPRAAYWVLDGLRQPRTLEELFGSLEKNRPEILPELERNLKGWFQDWAELGWICGADL